jgi:hypothetical protein
MDRHDRIRDATGKRTLFGTRRTGASVAVRPMIQVPSGIGSRAGRKRPPLVMTPEQAATLAAIPADGGTASEIARAVDRTLSGTYSSLMALQRKDLVAKHDTTWTRTTPPDAA